MGDKHKDTSLTLTRVKGQEYVFDTAFSLLMQDFSSAKLSSSSSVVITKEKERGEIKEHEDEIVKPLKNFHLQTPAYSKNGLKKHKRKGKSMNELNLSVAAGFIHRPVVWPARLSAPSSGDLTKKLLHPARLSAVTSLSKCGKVVTEKSGIEKTLNKKVIALLKKNSALDLSHVSEQKQLKNYHRIFGDSTGSADRVKHCDSFSSLTTATIAKKQKSDTTFHHNPPTFTSSSSDILVTASSRSNMLFTNFQSYNSSNVNTSYRSLTGLSSEDSPPARSCSHEMRLEETNVNELASYLDDMLHLPRPMSTMAEMMYA